MNKYFLIYALLFCSHLMAQKNEEYTIDDTLRGSITPERKWWDLNHYDLYVSFNIEEKTISGSNTITYKVLEKNNVMQIDLQPPLKMIDVFQDGEKLSFIKMGNNAYFINLKPDQKIGSYQKISINYGGTPRPAKNAPWDGGISWKKDSKGNPFVATSCQGLGSSVWWPCKDHMYDEPDSMSISVNVPSNLMDVSNGNLRKTEVKNNGTTTYHWAVTNPINNYGVNANIGKYAHFSEDYIGEKGPMKFNYYVLEENLEKAKVQFKQVKEMMKAFEHWFGPYPFYEDGFKLVEVPYLGMEHQSSVTYGNGYKNGYRGTDLSGTGWGLKWDFIIIHESGHEWFANNITYKDVADMWIHESFTAYSEALFTEYYYGKEAGAEYVKGIRKNIRNDSPIIGKYNLNKEGSGDMYYKGSNMLHTIRQIINNDKMWLAILRGLNKEFYHQTVTAKQIEDYIIKKSGKKLNKVFDQYLRSANIPSLQYVIENNEVKYRWTNCVEGFDMPIKVSFDQKKYCEIKPTTKWQTKKLKVSEKSFVPDENYYIEVGK